MLHQHRCGLLFFFFYFFYFYFCLYSEGDGRERAACFNESSYLFLFICIFFLAGGLWLGLFFSISSFFVLLG